MKPLAIVILTKKAEILASSLKEILAGFGYLASIHAKTGRAAGDVPFDDTIASVQQIFRDGQPIIGICAAGILIRALAPVLDEKKSDPAVLAMSEDGKSIVPLLGGHHGANDLARFVAELLAELFF